MKNQSTETDKDRLDGLRDSSGQLLAYAWPGGYPVLYLAADGGVLCPECANSKDCREAEEGDTQWRIISGDIHWEGPPAICDNCNKAIESAYGDPSDA